MPSTRPSRPTRRGRGRRCRAGTATPLRPSRPTDRRPSPARRPVASSTTSKPPTSAAQRLDRALGRLHVARAAGPPPAPPPRCRPGPVPGDPHFQALEPQLDDREHADHPVAEHQRAKDGRHTWRSPTARAWRTARAPTEVGSDQHADRLQHAPAPATRCSARLGHQLAREAVPAPVMPRSRVVAGQARVGRSGRARRRSARTTAAPSPPTGRRARSHARRARPEPSSSCPSTSSVAAWRSDAEVAVG